MKNIDLFNFWKHSDDILLVLVIPVYEESSENQRCQLL